MSRQSSTRTAVGMATAAAAVGLALTAPASPAAAENIVNVTYNMPAEVMVLPCTPTDVLVLHGVAHLVVSSTLSAGGNYRVTYQNNWQGVKGEGLISGLDYTAQRTSTSSHHVSPPFPARTTVIESVELISQGPAPDALLRVRLHETVTATGDLIVTPDDVEVKCKG